MLVKIATVIRSRDFPGICAEEVLVDTVCRQEKWPERPKGPLEFAKSEVFGWMLIMTVVAGSQEPHSYYLPDLRPSYKCAIRRLAQILVAPVRVLDVFRAGISVGRSSRMGA